MTCFLILLAVSFLFCVFVLPYGLRSYARKHADRIIDASILHDVKLAKRCIAILTWSNKWITKRVFMDLERIRQLKVLI